MVGVRIAPQTQQEKADEIIEGALNRIGEQPQSPTLGDPVAQAIRDAHILLSWARNQFHETGETATPKAICNTLDHARDYVGQTLNDYLKGEDLFPEEKLKEP